MDFTPTSLSPTVRFGSRRIPLPRSRPARVALGSSIIVVGVVGFALPIIGLWMIGPGMVVLSHDSHRLRRFRRRSEVWGIRRLRKMRKSWKSGTEDLPAEDQSEPTIRTTQ